MFCIGQSHMVCVLMAAEEAGTPLDAVALKDVGWLDKVDPTSFVVEHPERLSPETVEKLRGGPVYSFIGGMYHMKLCMGRGPQPFDFVLPEAPELALGTDTEVVPSGAMRAVLAKGTGQHLRAFEMIAELAAGPVYQFESPPPPTERWVSDKIVGAKRRRQGLKRERKLMEKRERGELTGKRRFEYLELADPLVRYKVWRLHSQLVREHTERLGGRFIPHPPAAVDDDGFLRDEFSRTVTHANAAYGALVLEQLRSLP